MSYNVQISEPAKNDLKETLLYIANILKAPQAAENLYSPANEVFNSLSEFPKRNSLIDRRLLGLSNIRYALVKNYIAFYTVDDNSNTVTIIRFLYNRREWKNILR